jgi:phosphosulfolactate synthase
MPGFDGFLDVPARSPKPRVKGLTHVIDKGMSLPEIEGLFDTAGDYVDIVKLGWGTSYVTRNLEKKIALYRSFGTPVVCGGTLFEAVVARGKLDEYRRSPTTGSRTWRSPTGRSSSRASASSS